MSMVRGWCPTLFEPMRAGDGLLLRIKPPLGRLDAAAARALADAAGRWGNGVVELSGRAALQVRGVAEAGLPAFRAAVLAAGLASADPAVERRRNVVVSPLATPAGVALATGLERWIAGDAGLAALPAKFGFAVASERDPCPLPGEIGLEPDRDDWRVRLAGCPITGRTRSPLATVQALAARFLALAAGYEEPPRRMAELVRCCGHAAMFADMDLALEAMSKPAPTTAAIAGRRGDGFALGLPFGACTADDLGHAAGLAVRFGDGVLRLSPWRALVLAGIADEAALAAAAGGFVVDPTDPRLRVTSCAGAPGCSSAHAATRADAAILAARRLPTPVHLSGCAKGCAHPGPAPVTLVGAPDGYALVLDGRAGDAPARRGLTLADAAAFLAG